MPKKIRQLESMLKKAGFENLGGKGSHRNYYHDKGYKITISEKLEMMPKHIKKNKSMK